MNFIRGYRIKVSHILGAERIFKPFDTNYRELYQNIKFIFYILIKFSISNYKIYTEFDADGSVVD
jgi:hypothetical protein